MPPNDESSRIAHPFVITLVIILGTLLVYGQALDFDLVWDDLSPNLTTNPWLNPPSLANLSHFWTAPYVGMYVPVTYSVWGLLVLVNERLAATPLDPALFHAANLVLHAINTLLVYLVLRRLLAHPTAALFGALVFLWHPVQAESVAWVSEFRGLLAASLGLGALVLHLEESAGRQRTETRPVRLLYGLKLLLTLLALLSKVSAAVIPLMGVVLEGFLYRGRVVPLVRRQLAWLAIPVLPLAVTATLQGQATFYFSEPYPLWAGPLIWSDNLGFYLYKLLLPIHLSVSYGRTPQTVLAQSGIWLTAMALPLLGLGAWWSRRRTPLLALSLVLFVIGFLPVSGLAPFVFQSWSAVADRYLYLSMVGYSLALAWAFREDNATARVLLGLLLAFFLFWSRAIQVPVWQNELRLWDHALAITPDEPIALNNRGLYRTRMGQWETGMADINRSLELLRLRRDPNAPRCGEPREQPSYYRCMLDNIDWQISRKPQQTFLINRAYALMKLGQVDMALYTAAAAMGRQGTAVTARGLVKELGWGRLFAAELDGYLSTGRMDAHRETPGAPPAKQ